MENGYEFGVGYVTVIPEIKNLSKELSKSLAGLQPEIEKQLGKASQKSFNSMIKGLSESTGQLNFSGLTSSFGNTFISPALNAFRGLGKSMVTTLSSSAQTAAKIAGGVIAGVGSVALAGGFQRALTENNALAKLEAFGYEAQQIESILASVNKVIDGTSFTKPETLGVTTQLLASGAKEGRQLEEILKQTGKLADMGGVSFAEMGDIIAKSFAGGTIYTEDINQLAGRGIAIWQGLADSMGTSVDGVKKALSDGEVSFEDLQGAINSLTFDSALFASKDATTAFNNFFTSIKKVGQSYWEPIIDNSAEFFNTMKEGISSLTNNPSYKNFLLTVQTRLENLMSKADVFAQKFKDAMGKLNFDEIVKKIEKIWEPFKGLEPLFAGLALALSSGFLSNLPIIGSLFSGISLPVGLLLGLVVVLNNKFESFGNLLKSIGNGISDFFTGIGNTISGTSSLLGESSPLNKFFAQLNNYISTIDFVGLGEKLGNGLNKIFTFLTDTASGLQSEIRPLYESIKEFLTDFFEMFSDVGGSIDGENLGKTIINILSALIDGVGALLPALETVFSTIGTIFTSDVFTSVFNTLIDIASFIVSNEAVLVTFVSILGALFVGSKLATLIQNFSSFQTVTTTMGDIFKGIFDNLMKTIKELPKLTKGIMGAISEFIKGLSKSLMELGKAAPGMAKNMLIAAKEFIKLAFDVVKIILQNLAGMAGAIMGAIPTILLISALIVGVTGLLLLLREMGLFEMLGDLITFMIEKMGDLLVIVADVLGIVLENIGNFLNQLANALTTMIPVISGAIVELVDAFGRNFTAVVSTLNDFLITLAIFGPMALIGATAFALGLGEIALALGALAGGSVIGGIADFLSGKDGSSLEVLTELVKSLATFSTEINKLPDTLMMVMPGAFLAGFKIGEEIQKGLFGGFNFDYVTSEFDSLISRLQTSADLNPIMIQVDDSNLRNYSNVSSGGSGTGRSSTFNDNSSRTINVTTKSENFVNEFIKSSRGYI